MLLTGSWAIPSQATSLLAAAEGPNPLVPHLSEIIVGLISFSILMFFVAKFAIPRFEAIYTQRTEQIEGGIKRAEQAQQEAQQALQQYREQLAAARSEAATIRDDARVSAQRIADQVREDARQESERIIASGRSQLDAQRAQIVAELRGDLGRMAVDLAGRIVGESLAEDARRRGTVDRFLDELDEVSSRTNDRAAPAPSGGE
jgi:F-type H+-transporting ATPase subunit b